MWKDGDLDLHINLSDWYQLNWSRQLRKTQKGSEALTGLKMAFFTVLCSAVLLCAVVPAWSGESAVISIKIRQFRS